jgi:biotin-(acetyl-CoA carboxylase) ligase
LNGRKLSGLIAQARQSLDRTEVVLGIGLNLRETPPDLKASTIALTEFGEPPAAEAFAELLLRELEGIFAEAHDFSWIRKHWEAAARLSEGRLFVLGESGSVEPLELLPTGELLVRNPDGSQRKLSSETVSLRFAPQP